MNYFIYFEPVKKFENRKEVIKFMTYGGSMQEQRHIEQGGDHSREENRRELQ